MRILKLAGQLEHLLSSHLSAGESANLSFNPNALRYSCGYYIYALLHILI
jgi:NADH:ubiquinone oxidoreductase subunit 3 (subunit A)